jgi:uncharacterized membrane protein YkvA (DUF1232 family)
MAASRWGVFRTFATALRTATKPGSPALGERLASLPRLVRATLHGEYSGTTRSRLFLIAAAIAYVVSPVDFVPEALLAVFGMADDAVVISWIAAALINETEAYLLWERSTGRTSGPGRSDADRSDTVRSHVVP